jgi:hypothetical protein
MPSKRLVTLRSISLDFRPPLSPLARQRLAPAAIAPYQEIRFACLELAYLWRQITAQAETLDRRSPQPRVGAGKHLANIEN